MPVRNVLVRDPARDIEHDDTTLSLNVVSITESSKLLLTSSVPNVEADRTKVGVESQRVDLDSESSCEFGSNEVEGEGKRGRTQGLGLDD